MNRFIKIINNVIVVLFIAMTFLFCLSLIAFADENYVRTGNDDYNLSDEVTYGYSTHNFIVNIKVNKDYTYDVTEKIDVNFANYKHGIIRNIPYSKNYKIKDVKVVDDAFKKYSEDNNLIIKIGKKNKTHIGKKSYTIKYKLVNYEKKGGENNIYVDVLPAGWETGIINADVKVELPKDFKYTDMKSFSGSYGISNDNYGTWTYDKNTNTLNFTCENLPRTTGVTLQVRTPAGYWQGAHSKYWSNYAGIAVIAIVLLLITMLRIKKGRHINIIVPINFNAPEDITPAELGYLVDNSVDKKDITALFFYLAGKGYISIKHESKENDELTFIGLKIPKSEPPFVKKFYMSLFGTKDEETIGKSIDLKNASRKIGNNFNIIKNQIEDEFTGDKAFFSRESIKLEHIALITAFIGYTLLLMLNMYRNNLLLGGMRSATMAEFFGITMMGITVSVVMSLLWFLPFKKVRKIYYFRKTDSAIKTSGSFILWFVIWFFINLVVLITLTAFKSIPVLTMTTIAYLILLPILILGFRDRSLYNAKLYGEIIGFRNFIETAELDRINMLVEENPSYFYDILPYAYVFGLTKKWIDKFNQIEIPHSDSYDIDNMDAFNFMRIGYIVDTIQKSSFSEILSATSHSNDIGGGGGGISFGGGFSGGGSGGGGGGAW